MATSLQEQKCADLRAKIMTMQKKLKECDDRHVVPEDVHRFHSRMPAPQENQTKEEYTEELRKLIQSGKAKIIQKDGKYRLKMLGGRTSRRRKTRRRHKKRRTRRHKRRKRKHKRRRRSRRKK